MGAAHSRADFRKRYLAAVRALDSARRRLVREAGRRKSAQRALAVSAVEHHAMEEKLRHLSRSLLASHEEERLLISRELHDALGQDLTAVNLHLAVLKEEVRATGLRGNVVRTQRLVRKSMRTVHEFARNLRPKLLDDLGLAPALRGLAREFGARHGVRVAVSAPEEFLHMGDQRRTALYRVAQEALVNVARHARARNVRITLERIPGGVRLVVWNDGRTFDVGRVQRSRTRRHLGLLCMGERMDMVGGTFSIRSVKGSGTTVRAEVAIPGPQRRRTRSRKSPARP